MASSPSKKNGMPSPIQKMERDAATNIWTIWYASQYGKLERVRSLLDRNAVSSIDVQEFRTQWSPLHFACRYGHSSLVAFLIARNANVDLQDWQGNTPLHLAAGWGDLDCVTLVLEGGADVRRTNNTGQTPLDVSISLARKDHIRLLKDWRPLGLSAEELAAFRQQLIANNTELIKFERALVEEPNTDIRLELQALHFKRQCFGQSHPGLFATYSKLVNLYRDNNKIADAFSMADHGLTLCESTYGRRHVDTARWVSALGELLLLRENFDQAIHCFVEAFNTISRPCSLQGETHHETMFALENLAIACEQAGMLKLTETHLKTLLTLLMNRYGGGYNAKLYHLNVRLASVLLAQKRVQEARELYVQCLPHAENLFGGTDDHTVACTDAIGKCCFLLGEFAVRDYHKGKIR
ncbi:Ankyrin repeat domain-containing protein 17 [Phytophthora nicotianae]|uniref:Ankyrin repeat domain-containing protein 17 n=1 Tax=Phytophthora nicotianae TaxID=4792 RepID=A0A0W8BJR1_PHYNI|nr:Ankyrin repeat domain-containing protein 17 [Phytophthora nicotianae]